MTEKKTIPALLKRKAENKKISALTAYDYPTALIADRADIDILLVGDSLGMSVLGYETTMPVSMEDMLHHTAAVVRGSKNSLIVADMPFGSYEADKKEALRNAVKLIKAGAQAVKLEGGLERLETISAITNAGIPVMAHIGLLPQTATLMDGYRVQGKDESSAQLLIETAQKLEAAKVFSIVLECVTSETAKRITESVDIPTIGIGAGAHCDGQVLVVHDMLGITSGHVPKFVKKYAALSDEMEKSFKAYKEDVEAGTFPADGQSFFMK